MKVKIGDEWYSAEDQFLSVQFTGEEMELVRGMTRENSPNLRFSAGRTEDPDEVLDWVKS